MKKTLLYALCGLTILQATHASAFTITQTWDNFYPTYKKWIRVICWSALAAGSAYLTYRGISYIQSEFKRLDDLSAQAKALHNTMLPEFTQTVQKQELDWLAATKNGTSQQEVNALYIDLQKNRTLLTDIVQGKKYFPEIINLYNQSRLPDAMAVFATELFCLAYAVIPVSLYGIYDAFMEPTDSNDSKPSSEWQEIKLNTPIPFDDICTSSDTGDTHCHLSDNI
ncbi:MAG TPA: hypothetical protein VGW78_05560 [Candidatus Babeliales bacterium]|nr:hypothetical protein [Candidatus Babeliales bacterium]